MEKVLRKNVFEGILCVGIAFYSQLALIEAHFQGALSRSGGTAGVV